MFLEGEDAERTAQPSVSEHSMFRYIDSVIKGATVLIDGGGETQTEDVTETCTFIEADGCIQQNK